jgi:hypothetical protein
MDTWSDVVLSGKHSRGRAMKMPETLIAISLLFFAMEVFPSCASEQTKTVQSTTTTTPAQPQTTTTTTTETTKPQEPDSVLGAMAHAVGTVILFPFRLIGDAVGLIV